MKPKPHDSPTCGCAGCGEWERGQEPAGFDVFPRCFTEAMDAYVAACAARTDKVCFAWTKLFRDEAGWVDE